MEAFARRLRQEKGIDAWLDKWEIRPGDSIVARINEGLKKAAWGLVFYSRNTKNSAWVDAEQETLIYNMIEGKVRVIPVMIDKDAVIPELLKRYVRRGVEEFDTIADAILGMDGKPYLGGPVAPKKSRCFVLGLTDAGEEQIHLTARIDGELMAERKDVALKRNLAASYSEFLQGQLRPEAEAKAGRSPEEGMAHALSSGLAQLGDELGELLFAGEIGSSLMSAIDAVPIGDNLELIYESNDDRLLALPFEAARLVGKDILPALHNSVTVRRRMVAPSDSLAASNTPIPGPLKILVAIGAPDEGKTSAHVLDLEMELQNILDSVADAARHGNAEVKFLEVGNPREIRKALEADAYHVLHLSGHGSPGAMEMEDEEGNPETVSVEKLVAELRQAKRPLPLVFLSFCHGGASLPDTVGFAHGLIRNGIPHVLSMQTRVTDQYATQLSKYFYEELANTHEPLPSHALAKARRRLEAERRKAVGRGAPASETQPEYATPSLFCGGEERPLVDYVSQRLPLSKPPVHGVHGTVFELGVGDLVGRRRELRRLLRVLRHGEDPESSANHLVAAALTGIGGVGKSSVAGRAMARLKEDGWLVAAVSGPFDLGGLAKDLGNALQQSARAELNPRGKKLANPELDDETRIAEIESLLAEESVLCVLDNFEDNLTVGGGSYKDPAISQRIQKLLESCGKGRLLFTCRYPIPGLQAWSANIPIGPLSPAQTRKLLHRLPGLGKQSAEDLRRVLRGIGGHPRVLEYLDGLLNKGRARLPQVTLRLEEKAAAAGVDLDGGSEDLSDALRNTLAVAAQDVLLAELLDLAREAGDLDVLMQSAVSSLPWEAEDIAHALHGEPQPEQGAGSE